MGGIQYAARPRTGPPRREVWWGSTSRKRNLIYVCYPTSLTWTVDPSSLGRLRPIAPAASVAASRTASQESSAQPHPFDQLRLHTRGGAAALGTRLANRMTSEACARRGGRERRQSVQRGDANVRVRVAEAVDDVSAWLARASASARRKARSATSRTPGSEWRSSTSSFGANDASAAAPRPHSASSEAWRVPASSSSSAHTSRSVCDARASRGGNPTRRSLRSEQRGHRRSRPGGNVGVIGEQRGIEVGRRVERGRRSAGSADCSRCGSAAGFGGGDGGARRLVVGDGVEERAEVVAAALFWWRRRRRSLTNLGGRRQARPLQRGRPAHTVAKGLPCRRGAAARCIRARERQRGLARLVGEERRRDGGVDAERRDDLDGSGGVLGRLRGLGGAPVLCRRRVALPLLLCALSEQLRRHEEQRVGGRNVAHLPRRRHRRGERRHERRCVRPHPLRVARIEEQVPDGGVRG